MFYFFKAIFKIIIFVSLFIFFIQIPLIFGTAKIDRLRKEAADIDQKVKTSQKNIKNITKKEQNIIDSLNDAEIALNNARKKIRVLKTDIGSLEKKITLTQQKYADMIKQIKLNETYAGQRIAQLYKLSKMSKIEVLINAESIIDFFQRKKALELILAYDNKLLKEFEEQKTTLQKIRANLDNQKSKHLNLEKKYKKQVRLLSHQKAQKKKLLSDIQNKKSLAKASLASLKKSAKQLDQKIKAFELNQLEYKKKSPSGSFKSFKGLLKMPVKGKIISSFGPYKNTEFNVLNFQSGINIKADRGEPIHSVCAGKVIYASWFKGYGNMIIIDHGDHYYTLYAHAEELFKFQGDTVNTGDVIATVGDSGSMRGPGLHFELRYHGKPIDPKKWLKNG